VTIETPFVAVDDPRHVSDDGDDDVVYHLRRIRFRRTHNGDDDKNDEDNKIAGERDSANRARE